MAEDLAALERSIVAETTRQLNTLFAPPQPADVLTTASTRLPKRPLSTPLATQPRETVSPQLVKQAIEQFNNGRYEEAGRLAEQILAADANHIVGLRILGVVARKAKQFDRALAFLIRAVDIEAENAVLQFELGLTYTEMRRHREAYDCFLRSTQLNPTFQPSFVNVSAVLEQQERFEEALQWARKAAALKPDCPLAHYNVANTLRECGRVAESIGHYRRSIELRSDYAKAKWNLGICHVLLGQFSDAWPLFELRDVAEEVKIDNYTQPRWDGSSLAGKTIVVHAEQGIGDEVLFASCFPDVIARAEQTILVCEPRLAKLFARSFPQAIVYGWARRKDWSPMPLSEPIDYQIPAGSLPLHLRNRAEDFPQRERFLTVDPALRDEWRGRFAALGPGLNVGISWRAGGKANEGRKRTIALLDWREMLSTAGVHFVNLQYGDTTEDFADVQRELGVRIHDWEQGDPLVDVDSYAAKIAALDLVISVGNAAVHLAGAVGTPAWTLLPRIPSWRWMVTGDTSPWYSSVRLFRQPRRCQWEPVLQQIATRLREVADDAAKGMATDELARRIRAVLPHNEPPEASPIEPPSTNHVRWLDANELGTRQPLQLIADLQERAEAAHGIGDLTEAERLYREILQVTPRHLKAHFGLGLIAREKGRFDAAIRALQRGLSIYEPNAANHAYLAGALVDAGRIEEALHHARRAIELDPKLSQGHLELSRALQAAGKHGAALDCLHQSLHVSQGDIAVLCALSRSLTCTGRLDDAVQMLRQAIDQLPDEPQLHLAFGVAMLEDQCLDDAERCIQRAIVLKPSFAEAHHQLARLMAQRGKFDEAIAANRRAIEHHPNFAPAITDLAMMLQKCGQPEQAEPLYRKAIELRPECAELHHLLGAALAEQERCDEALTEYDFALRIDPNSAAAHVSRASALLILGRLAEGWDEYEQHPRSGMRFPQPMWDGSSLANRTLLVFGDHDIGDEIMFATCYPEIIQQSQRCVIVCQSRLERTFRRSFPQAVVLGVPQGSESSWRLPSQLAIDVQCPAGSLPRYLRRAVDAFPRQPQLLTADQMKVAAWRERFAALGPGKKIGIAWRQAEAGLNHQRRTAPISQWQFLLSTPGVQWINLQSGDDCAELDQAVKQLGVSLHDSAEANHPYDLDGLAAKLAALDLVISVDATISHLAAAVGTPTWVVFSEPADWRWLAHGDECLWYGSVRLFRKSRLGNWESLFRQLREELLKRSYRLDEQSSRGSLTPPHWSHSLSKARR